MQWRINNPVVVTAHGVLRRYWQRALQLRERLEFKEEAFHLFLAGIVGLIGGVVNLGFFYATDRVKQLFLLAPGDPVEVAEMMVGWQRVFLPAVGGLAAGLVLYWGLRLVGKQGSTNLLEVVVAGDGRLPFRTEMVKTWSSLLSIATGASIGREGGITQLSATLASKLGQFAKWPPYRLRLLVGCGAASGIAAAYNAPVAGAVFSAAIVLGNFSMTQFAPLVFSSVIAAMVSRSFFGMAPVYQVPAFPLTNPWQLAWFVLLGILCGVVGAFFLKLLRVSEKQFSRLNWPIYLRLTVAGLVVGLIALVHPGVCGNGYSVTNRILHEEYMQEAGPLLWLGGLFIAKMAATACTVGAGTVGGVFTPTLFLGASAGALFGGWLHAAGGATHLPTGAFALVGMGAVLAATTRSPFLAMIMVFEMSLDYTLMPPLMLACVVAILVAQPLHGESIYTEHLRLRGLLPGQESRRAGVSLDQTVGDRMQAPVPPLPETARLKDIADRFLTGSNNFLPVVDAHQRLVGMVALQDLKEFLKTERELDAVIAADVMRPPPKCLTPNQRLLNVLPVVLESELKNIPVVNSLAECRLVGSLARGEVLSLFSEALSAGTPG